MAAQQKTAQAKAAAEADTTALFYAALQGNATDVVLKNKNVELTVNTKGGVVSKAVIKNFEDCNGNKDVTLFDSKTQSLNFATAGYAVATAPQAAKSILQGIFGIIAVTENPCGNALQPLPKPHKNRCKSITFHLSFSSLYFVSHRVNALHPIL